MPSGLSRLRPHVPYSPQRSTVPGTYIATAGFSAEVAALVTEDPATFARLEAPVKRVCALQVPIPYTPVLENHVFPDRNRIIAAIRETSAARSGA